jgi:hypothetical protein
MERKLSMTKFRELINLHYKGKISISKFLEEINNHFITPIEHYSSASEKWATTSIKCCLCGHYWQAVYPVQVVVILGEENIRYPELECPNCEYKNIVKP